MKKNKISAFFMKIYKLLLFILILSVLIYYFKFRPVKITEWKVSRGSVTNTVMGTGTLDAKTKMIISTKIPGRIEKILFDQGDMIKAGQLVVELDKEELAMQVKIAEATLKTAKSSMKKLKYDLDYAKAVLSNAEKVYRRQQKLIESNIVSQSVYDKSVENLKIAKANFNRSQSAIIEAEARILEAQRSVALRKAQLAYTQIRAPFDGIVTKRVRDPGDIVVPGTPILSIVSLEVLWIESWVGETELEKVKVGQFAEVVFRSLPDAVFPGKVLRIAKEVDKETREFIVDVGLDKIPKNWAVGQRAEVYIVTDKKENTLMIPEGYLKWKNNRTGVFTVKNHRSLWVPVEKGIEGKGFIEILHGLNEGDIVIKSSVPGINLLNQQRISAE